MKVTSKTGLKKVCLNLSEIDLTAMKKVAKEAGCSVSFLIRTAIKRYLRERAGGREGL